MEKKIMLSPTAVNMYMRCPRKFYLRYVKKLKSKPSIYLIRGMAVHGALAKFFSLNITPDSEVSALKLRLVTFFHEAWAKQSETVYKLALSQDDIDKIYIESINMLYAWHHRFLKTVPQGIHKPRTEVKLFSRKDNLMGIIDAIYEIKGHVLLVDYKTSGKDDITSEIEIQMALYALLYLENYRKLPDLIAVDFLQTGARKFFPATKELVYEARSLCSDITEKTQSKKEEDYPCTCGGWCDKEFEHVDPPR
jgi:CRISPR/Cas system-associated exonuclease Cas4 (RecB family)